jgi:hypothetical protein
MISLEGGPSILSCRRKTDIAISVGAGRCALLYEIINYKRAHPTSTYQGLQLGARRSSAQRYEELLRAGTAVSNKVSSDLED